jgi:hypothetical protein
MGEVVESVPDAVRGQGNKSRAREQHHKGKRTLIVMMSLLSVPQDGLGLLMGFVHHRARRLIGRWVQRSDDQSTNDSSGFNQAGPCIGDQPSASSGDVFADGVPVVY